jgi:hypothetical protein
MPTIDELDAQLGAALGLKHGYGHWGMDDTIPRGTYLRYVWRLSAGALLMVAGFDVSDDPNQWRPHSPRWRAALGVWNRDLLSVVTADPVIDHITAVHWCRLRPFARPPYGMQADGSSYDLSFWTAENCGVSVNVDFLSSLRQRSVMRVRKAAVELANMIARTSDNAKFREDVASCFPGAGVSWDRPPPDPTELREFVSRVQAKSAEILAGPDPDFEYHALLVWSLGVDDTRFDELLPGYPPELAARVIPVLRRLREDDES